MDIKTLLRKLRRFVLGGALVIGLKSDSTTIMPQTKEPQANTKEKTNYNTITINTIQDMYDLFDMSLNIIFAELVLEEVPMANAYDDQGIYKGTKNTIGTGSTYAPLNFNDYNNPNAKWYHLSRNPKSFGNRTISHQEMLQLVIGWAKYRTQSQDPKTGEFKTHKTVLNRMFVELQGTPLRPNEFAALFCAIYNNENNISNLCPYIKNNHDDKIACANKIMFWHKTGAANGGPRDRCEFEALVYLNTNDFCAHIMELYTKPLTQTGQSCINAEGVIQQILTTANYIEYSNDALAKYKGVVYPKGVCTRDVCANSLWHFINPLPIHSTLEPELQKNYDKAIKIYNQGDYDTALVLLLELESQGASGTYFWNDIAITCYKLHQYDNCIAYCEKILKSNDLREYAKACYNAGLAYEAKGDYDNAIAKYDDAITYYSKYGISNPSPRTNYEKIYKTAKSRATVAKSPTIQYTKSKIAKFQSGQKRMTAKATTKRAKNQFAINQRKDPRRTA